MNKYLNKRYADDLTEIERMSMHQPATFDSTFVTPKIRMSKKKPNQIKTTREEARFFGEGPSQPKRKRIQRPQQEHAVQRDLARPVQRKDLKYKNAAEVGIEKAKQKRSQPGTDWLNEVISPPNKKIRMIVAENELPVSSSTKTTSDVSSKKPHLKSKKVTYKSNEKVTKPPNQLHKSRPRSKSRNEARPSKSDKKSKSASGDKNAEKQKKIVTESPKPKSDSKKISKIEDFRKPLAEEKSNAEREHVRETGLTSAELPPIIDPAVQQRSVLDDLGFSSSQESNASEVEKESETIVQMEIPDEQPSEIIEIIDDENDVIPPCPPCPTLSFDDSEDEDDDDDVIFVSSSAPIHNLPLYQDPSTGQNFCYGQDLDEF